MKIIKLNINNEIFIETEKILKERKISLNEYVQEALLAYNKFQNREILKEILRKDSSLCREDSMEVLKEFEALPDPIPDLD